MTNKILLSRLYEVIRPLRSKLAIAMVAAIIVAGLNGTQAWMIKPLIDRIFIEKNISYLTILPFGLFLLFLVKGFFYGLNYFMLETVGQNVILTMRTRLFNHVVSQPLSFFHNTATGELISRVMADITLLQAAMSSVVVGLLRDFFQVIFLLIVIFSMNWKLALLSLIFIPMAAVPIIKFGKIFRRLSIRIQEEMANTSSLMHESITGAPVVKAFAMEEYESSRFGSQVTRLFDALMEKARYYRYQHPLMECIGGLGIVVIVWFGGKEVIYGKSTPGEFFSFLTALFMIYEPIKGVSKVNATVQDGLAAAGRVFTLLDLKPEIDDREGAIPLPPFSDTIRFDNIHFHYNDKTEVIKGLDLTVKSGEVLAIVGPSGSGKSTVTSLLPRFFDINEGSITIDGHDVRDVTLHSLRSQIGIVTQQTILFNDSVRNNIAYGEETTPEEAIREAAANAHALEFIERLPKGFDTVIGESGVKLSGGERQRLCIARAILKNAPILILDEATSSLDTESERKVQVALENLMKNRTTLVIAHRLSTIKNADRIIVLKQGVIVEDGTHNELIALGGEYEGLYNMQ
ncbi:MAG: ABC transporter transmembrane domain-containing protein [Thermodesulfobacteriota bacterium]